MEIACDPAHFLGGKGKNKEGKTGEGARQTLSLPPSPFPPFPLSPHHFFSPYFSLLPKNELARRLLSRISFFLLKDAPGVFFSEIFQAPLPSLLKKAKWSAPNFCYLPFFILPIISIIIINIINIIILIIVVVIAITSCYYYYYYYYYFCNYISHLVYYRIDLIAVKPTKQISVATR